MDSVGKLAARLNRSDVWVNQDRFDSFFSQGLEALAAGVVEIAAGSTSSRLLLRPLLPRCPRRVLFLHPHASDLLTSLSDFGRFDEPVEDEIGVVWTWRRFRVELNSDAWSLSVENALDGPVVRVHEPRP